MGGPRRWPESRVRGGDRRPGPRPGRAWLDCEVRHRLDLGSHLLFVGEVVAVGGPDGAMPPVLRMEDTRMNYGG